MNLSQILPNLIVGSCPIAPEDIDRLKRDGVTAVLNVQTDDDMAYWGLDWPGLERHYREVGIDVRRVPVQDFDRQDLRERLPECVEALRELLAAGHKVYVHCNMAVNRSPTVVIAYLHWVLGWSLTKAADYVMRLRPSDPYLDAIQLASRDRLRRPSSDRTP
ncbi:MAG: dual specificity protein phosphatase family protein [Planctomycetaceae bacterium]|nr:dual specificity protein phosphatase family protein [Planctomycetaceae bacterium]